MVRKLSLAALALAAVCLFAVLPASAKPSHGTGVLQPSYCNPCLFYSGDFNPSDPNANALANETDAIVSGSPYGSAIYMPFIVPSGQTWNVTGIFTNNLMSFNLQDAYYEIRTGMSVGNGGTLVASGTDAKATQTPTGRSGFGFLEYTVAVNGLSGIHLTPGEYWLAVVPQCTSCEGRSFESNEISGINAFGPPAPQNQALWNSSFFAANYADPNSQGTFPAFSAGVEGTIGTGGQTPEPASLFLFGSGLLGVAGYIRRRLHR